MIGYSEVFQPDSRRGTLVLVGVMSIIAVKRFQYGIPLNLALTCEQAERKLLDNYFRSDHIRSDHIDRLTEPNRIYRSRALNDVIKQILNAEELPSPPGVALRILELYNDPTVEVKEMAAVIGTDPVLTAKLIKYCNSPLLARNDTTSSVNQAIVVVGMRAVKILALSFSLVCTKSSSANSQFNYEQFWNQSLALAVVAQTIGVLKGRDGNDEFLLGLMMKIGQVGLAHTFPTDYDKLQEQSDESGVDITQLEEQKWDVNHFNVTVELLRAWHFPENIVDGMVQFEAIRNDEGIEDELTRVLRLSEQIVSLLFSSDLDDEDVENAKTIALEWFGVDNEQFVTLFDDAKQAWTEFAVLLNFDASQSFEQLERSARKAIAQLSIGLHAENTAVNEENAKLKISAMVDALTGLKNRRAYDEEAPAEWERSKRMGRPFGVMMVDIDHFKHVNDTYGHAAGDQALEAVADALRKNARQYDSVFRFGGEEFVVMVPECSPETAYVAGERFRKSIEEMVIDLPDEKLKITASIGIAVRTEDYSGDLESLLADADKLLYQAKSEGRNRVCCIHKPGKQSQSPGFVGRLARMINPNGTINPSKPV